MKREQQKYAMGRIDDIRKQKLAAIKESLPVVKVKKINYTQALKLIRAGKVELMPGYAKRVLYRSDDFEDVLDMEPHHSYCGTDSYDEKKYEQKAGPVRAEAQRIKDQIMLGDAAEALAMIEAFAKM